MEAFLTGLGDVGPTGLLALVVLLILTGGLYTRKSYMEMRSERDYWRDTALKSNEALLIQAQTQVHQLELGRTSDAFIRSLPLRREGQANVADPPP